MAMQGLASRRTAVEVLLKVEQESAFANQALSNAFAKNTLQERDRAFVTYIVQGTLRHQIEIDTEISKLSKKPLEKLNPVLRAILRTAIFQLAHMKDVPPSAVINTSVEIARKTGHEGSAKFANALLRNFQRTKKNDAATEENNSDESNLVDASVNDEKALSQRYSMPEWIVNRWIKRYELDECKALLEYSQKIPNLILRCNEEAISPEGLISIFEGKGMTVKRSELMPACIEILDRGTQTGPINKLPGYEDGLFSVQDDASAFVVTLLEAKPGQTIVDLCAAPGGKSIFLGEQMQNKGRVIAVDSSAKRLSLLGNERRRIGLQNIETVVRDGREFTPDGPCDAVLIDAPCSGTGVLNRRADLRQNRKSEDIDSLIRIQEQLLEQVSNYLKPGASMVYSTCSIEPEENEKNIEAFLAKHPEFSPVNLEPYFSQTTLQRWQQEKHWEETQKQLHAGYIQLLPSRHACSGFFISKLKREPQ